jgi:GNAT superfamily N-acetyltransferase
MSVGVIFRLCRKGDLEALEWMGLFTRQRALITAAFAAQEAGRAALLLAMANDFPVGQVWLDWTERGSEVEPRIWALRVFPPLQGTGLGAQLLRGVEILAAGRVARAVTIGVEPANPTAQAFYLKRGYRRGREENETVDYTFEGQPLRMEVSQHILRKSLVGDGPDQSPTS